MRFGHGTWAGILAERQKRIQEQREAQAKARKAAQLRHNEMMDNIKMGAIIVFVMALAIFLFFFLLFSAAMASTLIK